MPRHGALDRVGDPDPDRDGKLGRLGLEPAQRYERARPGELIHIDVKKLGRIQGGAGHARRVNRRYTSSRATPPASDRT